MGRGAAVASCGEKRRTGEPCLKPGSVWAGRADRERGEAEEGWGEDWRRLKEAQEGGLGWKRLRTLG